ncbi:MAG TPA: fibrobacter succinogenes major paralogous domain-containing protein [Candidatus Rikenella faecigallinarum]|uniref:Fibrobacter succinogenes major paralogous domain-containing protein n=1 Tax=Candidatus Rikenella faecigallinarum TaxID=2838745 RepID=A0A9D1QCX8_9BACT|nr:fibrobacter succinogenes major paralogous domain-containing protein [Candidatus Rikenella faecigallinarum]
MNIPNAVSIVIYGTNEEVLVEGDKFGINYVDIASPGVINENNSLTYSIKHPLMYIYQEQEPQDWYTDNPLYQNNALWGVEGSNKSNYDPCPNKWRMPSEQTWNDYSTLSAPYYVQGQQAFTGDYTVSNGRLYNALAWLPATGRREYGSGPISRVGNFGYYWSLTPKNSSASNCRISMSNLSPNYGSFRAGGFSVRCVQE